MSNFFQVFFAISRFQDITDFHLSILKDYMDPTVAYLLNTANDVAGFHSAKSDFFMENVECLEKTAMFLKIGKNQ